MTDKFRRLRQDLFTAANPACSECGAREGHFVNCPNLGKPEGARDPAICPKCFIAHNGECF